MKEKGWISERRSVMGQLYGYIYSMLVSNALVGMPLFGGALYLCGKAVLVYSSIYARRNRAYLPDYARKWSALLLAVLMVLALLLIGLFPTNIESTGLWVLFAAVSLSLLIDGLGIRIERLRETGTRIGRRAGVLIAFCLALLTGAAAWILMTHLPHMEGLALTAGFALRAILRMYTAFHGSGSETADPGKPVENEDIEALKPYRAFEWLSLLLIAAMEMTLAVMYALLAVNRKEILFSLAVALLCTVGASEIGRYLLRRSERKTQSEPVFLLYAGLSLWLIAVLQCGGMLHDGHYHLTRILICLVFCSGGASLCASGLMRIEALMPDVILASGRNVPLGYGRIRQNNWELAELMGDVLALIALTVFGFVTRGNLPREMDQLARQFQPVMFVPLGLVIFAALLSVIRFPFDERAAGRIRRFLQLQRAGEANPALQKQVSHVVAGKYRQPLLTKILIFILRLGYRHRVINAEAIPASDGEPIVFLCNHGEIYGPIVCALYFPVPFRPWVISMMMHDRKKVSQYMYENTFGPKENLPKWLRISLARVLGSMSVTVMNQLEAIPVYRDSPEKLRDTIRQSVECLEAGDHLLIFPENTDHKYELEGVGELNAGFVMLALAYWRKTKKSLRFMPLAANHAARTITFGEIITFRPEAPFAQEKDRIVREAEEQMKKLFHPAQSGNL